MPRQSQNEAGKNFRTNCKKNLQIKFLCLYLHQFLKRTQPILRKKKTKKMEKLNYTTREINRNFKIKVSGQFEGQKIHTLVGVAGLLKVVGDVALTNRLLNRAFNTMNDVEVCRLRRGIKISFYIA